MTRYPPLLFPVQMESEHQKTTVIAFVGGGNMAGSIIGGLVASGWPVENIRVSDPDPERRKMLAQHYGVTCLADNVRCIQGVDAVILSVKPQVMKEVVIPLRTVLQHECPLLISIAAGIRSTDILRWVGRELAFVRVMPNTPALIRKGVSGLWANVWTVPVQRDMAEETMGAVGDVVWVNAESEIDIVTGISGSGPAYFFKLMELMIKAATEQGLDPTLARPLVLKTALGAASLICQNQQDPEVLCRQVTSPGGTTEAGICRMEELGLEDAIRSGISAAVKRSNELSDQYGEI